MNWFTGEVLEAITLAKSKKAIFVVVVIGSTDDDSTKSLNEILEDKEVADHFDSMVCIKVENGSAKCNQFSQIYPVLLVPSVFFIDSSTGVDLEITGGVLTKDSLLASVTKAIRQNIETASSQSVDVSPEITAEATPSHSTIASSTVSEPETTAPSNSDSEPGNPELQARIDNATHLLNEQMPLQPGDVTSHATPTPLEDRVERAKRLLAERQMAKEKEEREKEKLKEVERRNLGKEMREMQKSKEEKEVMKAAMERKKEKAESKAAMEAVRAQIAQDRADRADRYNAEKAAEAEKRKEAEKKVLEERARQAEQAVIDRSQIARLQFRLPDGRHQTKQFSADSALSSVYEFVEDELDTGFQGGFSLSTTFPRRRLDGESRTTSLRQLEMAPSATVLVLPLGGGSGGSVLPAGGLASILQMLFTPFTVLYALVMSFFNTGPGRGSGDQRGGAAAGQRSGGSVRQQGNIGRLRNGQDDDDENNTWNGNSTQQM